MAVLISRLRNSRIVAVAMVLAMFAQFAMVTHEVLAEHSPGEHCAICVGQHTFGDALAASAAAAIPVAVRSFWIDQPSIDFSSAAVSAVRNRGPPVL